MPQRESRRRRRPQRSRTPQAARHAPSLSRRHASGRLFRARAERALRRGRPPHRRSAPTAPAPEDFPGGRRRRPEVSARDPWAWIPSAVEAEHARDDSIEMIVATGRGERRSAPLPHWHKLFVDGVDLQALSCAARTDEDSSGAREARPALRLPRNGRSSSRASAKRSRLSAGPRATRIARRFGFSALSGATVEAEPLDRHASLAMTAALRLR